MILPDNLHPLPVSSDESERRTSRGSVGFVNDAAVRHLLVGPLAVGRQRTCYHGADGGFAGRVEDSPFVSLAAEEIHDEAPAKAFGAAEEPAPVRRAAAPHPRGRGEVEPARASRPWLLSAAMLMIGLLAGSGLFALRAPTAPEPPATVVPGAAQQPAPEEAVPSFAATDAAMP